MLGRKTESQSYDGKKISDATLCFGFFILSVFPAEGKGKSVRLDGLPSKHDSILTRLDDFWERLTIQTVKDVMNVSDGVPAFCLSRVDGF